MYRYDKHYKTLNYFGDSYPGLIKFFKEYPNKCKVLDLGCGQGRDSISLGRLGYDVTGIDLSEVGIRQLNEASHKEGLNVKGHIFDIYDFEITDEYDMILMDSIFHFYKKDYDREKELLLKVIGEMKVGGVFCNFILKGKKRESDLKKIIKESGIEFQVLLDDYTEYPKYNDEFHMYIIKKF